MGIENIYNYKLCKVHAFRKGGQGPSGRKKPVSSLVKLMGDGET